MQIAIAITELAMMISISQPPAVTSSSTLLLPDRACRALYAVCRRLRQGLSRMRDSGRRLPEWRVTTARWDHLELTLATDAKYHRTLARSRVDIDVTC